MPKKTKKDKILAEARRKILAEKQLSYNFVKPQSSAVQNTSERLLPENDKSQKYTAKSTQTDISILEHKYLRVDLLKILAFTLIAVILQGVLYYFLRS